MPVGPLHLLNHVQARMHNQLLEVMRLLKVLLAVAALLGGAEFVLE